jgi:hopanoid biosynthesis associated radical SAM protein HpnH
MAIPVSQMYTVASYVLRQKLKGNRRYPLVLMLEPLYRCNLACAGCGKIQYPSQVLKAHLTVERCVGAAEECGAPIVSIAGGEPLMHPEIERIAAALVARRKYVYLCTNALLLEEKLHRFTPSKYLSFSVHLDGLAPEHDVAVCRAGTYRTAVRAIRVALDRGFRVTTNTTLFEGADPERTRLFFEEMMRLGVEGMMISPGYSYDAAPDQRHFLRRERTRDFFRRLFAGGTRRWRFNQSPLFLEFLTGARDYDCTPWGNPTYTPFGWQRPCYLQQDGYAATFRTLIDRTEWLRFGHRSGNPKCRDCMVHSGFEASAVADAFSSPRGMLAMVRALLFGPRRPREPSIPNRHSRGSQDRESAVAHRQPPPTQGYTAPAGSDSLRAAFDYRGDVTLTLRGGDQVEGFVTNVSDREIFIWEKAARSARPIAIDWIHQVALTGRDPAAGRAWQTWVEQHRRRLGDRISGAPGGGGDRRHGTGATRLED